MRKLALTMLLLTVTVGWAQDEHADHKGGGENNSTVTQPPSDEKTAATMPTVPAAPSYVIGVADVLQITVWKEPDLTTTLPVRSDGMISLPLLNDVQAAGLTPMQLSSSLSAKLKKYVASPNVSVVVTQTNSHQIYVLGEVMRSGPIPLLHDMTVLQALATAGFSQFANTKGIYVLRTENGQERKIPYDYKRVIKGGAASQNILLQPGDVIIVP
jgi:polysaccharide export outer membrane protein